MTHIKHPNEYDLTEVVNGKVNLNNKYVIADLIGKPKHVMYFVVGKCLFEINANFKPIKQVGKLKNVTYIRGCTGFDF